MYESKIDIYLLTNLQVHVYNFCNIKCGPCIYVCMYVYIFVCVYVFCMYSMYHLCVSKYCCCLLV